MQMKQNVPDGYKLTEVGVIPEDWGVKELSDFIGSLEAGISVNSVDDYESSGHGKKILKTSCVTGGKFIPYEAKAILPKDLNRAKFNPRKNSIIISRMNTPFLVGEVGYVGKDYPDLFLPDRLWQVKYRNEDIVDGKWLSLILSYAVFSNKIKETATGTSNSMKNISKGNLLSIRVPCPTKNEQTIIANSLFDIEVLVTSLEKLIAKKRVIKTAAMQQLLTGKKRLPPFDKSHTGYKQTELGEIPEGWDVVAVGSLVAFNNGAAHENVISEYGSYTVVNSKFISTEGGVAKYSDQPLCSPKKGNVLMVMSDIPNGRAIAKCFVVDEDEKYTVNQRICSMEPLGIESKFLFYVLNRNKFYLQFDDGVKQTNLRKQDVLECPIQLPSLREQVLISTALTEMDQDITTLEKKLIKTQQLKQGMMQELLTGKTRLVAGEV